MKINKILAFAAVSLLSGNVLFAQTTGGEEAMAFSAVSRDPVAAGRAFTGFSSTSGTAWASFNNVSVVPLSEKKLDVAASYQSWAPKGVKSSNISFGGALKLGKSSGLTIGFYHGGGQEYSLTDEAGNETGTFKPKETQLSVGYGAKIAGKFGVGANLKYLGSKLSEDDSYSSVGFDVMATAKFESFNVALGVTNVGVGVKSADGETFSLPSALTLGGTYKVELANNPFEANVDVNYYFSGNLTAAAGVQYDFAKVLSARAGYHFGTKEAVLPSFATVGLGVHFKGVRLDFAYLMANEALKNTITIGLGYSF